MDEHRSPEVFVIVFEEARFFLLLLLYLPTFNLLDLIYQLLLILGLLFYAILSVTIAEEAFDESRHQCTQNYSCEANQSQSCTFDN